MLFAQKYAVLVWEQVLAGVWFVVSLCGEPTSAGGSAYKLAWAQAYQESLLPREYAESSERVAPEMCRQQSL